MKKIYFYLFLMFLTLSNSYCFSQKISGYFYLNEDGLSVHIENKEKRLQIIIEGLNESLLSANFFNSKGEEVDVHTERSWTIDSAQNWTRLFAASPDGTNIGAIHNVMLTSFKFPSEEKKAEIRYLVFTAKVMRFEEDRSVGEPKEVEIRLEVKSRDKNGKGE